MREEAEIQRELPEVLFSSLQRQPESIIEQGCVCLWGSLTWRFCFGHGVICCWGAEGLGILQVLCTPVALCSRAPLIPTIAVIPISTWQTRTLKTGSQRGEMTFPRLPSRQWKRWALNPDWLGAMLFSSLHCDIFGLRKPESRGCRLDCLLASRSAP